MAALTGKQSAEEAMANTAKDWDEVTPANRRGEGRSASGERLAVAATHPRQRTNT
jgi:hypothetical protein